MKEREDHGERIHRRVWELLPWYVNGTLAEREREQVELHLAGCAGCQAEERACRHTEEMLSGAGEVAPSPHPAQFRRLLDRVETEERGPHGKLAAFRSLVQATPRPLRRALLAQAAVILLLLGGLAWSARPPAPAPAPASYVTLSSPAAPPVPSMRLRVMFSPNATEREIRRILRDVRGGIVAGPSPIGAYTVQVPAAGDPVGAVLARLRTEPQVVFAQPAAGEAPQGPDGR
jgi:anti-sigma factor RsiW